MKKIKTLLVTFLCSVFVLTVFSCSTTVPVKVKRPAKLDMQGARTLAVLPFQPKYVDPTLSQSSMRGIFSSSNSNDKDIRDKEEICSNLTYALEETLASTEYYELQIQQGSKLLQNVELKYLQMHISTVIFQIIRSLMKFKTRNNCRVWRKRFQFTAVMLKDELYIRLLTHQQTASFQTTI